jgi:hypothetical protein
MEIAKMGPDQTLPHALKRTGNSELEIESESLSSEGCILSLRQARPAKSYSFRANALPNCQSTSPPSHGDTMVLRFS